MKRAISSSLLGIVTSAMTVAPCSGQGFISFANYGASTYSIVTYAASNVPVGKAGLAIGPGFSASLYYGLGDVSDPNALTLLGGNTGFPRPYPTPFSGSSDGDTNNLAGFFIGPNVAIPDYTVGPVTFKVVAWANSGPYGGTSYDTASLRGASTLFTLPSIAVGAAPVGEFGPSLLPFTVQIVPEPSTLALVGFGGLALLAFGRRSRR